MTKSELFSARTNLELHASHVLLLFQYTPLYSILGKMLVTMRFGRIGVTTLIHRGASFSKTLTTIYSFLIPRTLRQDCEWASTDWVVQFLRYHQALKLALQERGRQSPDDDKDWTTFMLDARFALFDVTLTHSLTTYTKGTIPMYQRGISYHSHYRREKTV